MWLSFDQVTLGYPGGPPVLADVTFRVSAGLWVVTGRNGSGKTSLLRAAAGILRPRAGALRLTDTDAWQAPLRYRWHLGYAPQELLDLPALTVREYLTYLAALKGIRRAHQSDRVGHVMTQANLPDSPMHTLSTGAKRRLGLAAALLNDPDLLVLDEPTAGMDPQEKVRFRLLLTDLAADRIVLLSTHLPEEAAGVADGWLTVQDQGVTCYADSHQEPDQVLHPWRQGAR